MIIKRYIFIIIILLLIIMFFLGSINVQAKSLTDLEQQEQDRENRKEGLEDPTANPDSWKPILIDEPELKEKAGIILSIINIIGIVCSVIVISILGLKYMVGSIEQKAEYKKTIWLYVLGMFLLISATTLPNLIYNFVISSF